MQSIFIFSDQKNGQILEINSFPFYSKNAAHPECVLIINFLHALNI